MYIKTIISEERCLVAIYKVASYNNNKKILKKHLKQGKTFSILKHPI